MQTVVLQGNPLDGEKAATIAKALNGELVARRGYFRVQTPAAIDRQQLATLRAEYACDINVLPADFDPGNVKLLITDMDSTFINIECIDEIADFLGIKHKVAEITEAAMRGELDFAQSLTRRVGLLAGLDFSALHHVYDERLRINPGGEAMLAGLERAGVKVALVSGGFTFFTERLKSRYKLFTARANTLDVADNKLTGKIVGDIVGAEGKQAFLLELCSRLGISRAQVVAMGDGANDLKMMGEAGLSIAYHAKPKVQEQALAVLNHCGLEGVLGLLDIDVPQR